MLKRGSCNIIKIGRWRFSKVTMDLNKFQKLLSIEDTIKRKFNIISEKNLLKELLGDGIKNDIFLIKRKKSFFEFYKYPIIFLIVVYLLSKIKQNKENQKIIFEFSNIFENFSKVKTEKKITFKDVKGLDEILPEFKEILDYMKNKKKYEKIGADLPKGILLTGPPGCGKTFLVKALAGETNWKFYYKSGSDFDDMYVGVGAERIKKLFAEARKNSPAIIFIDEIDSVAGKREKSIMNSNQTINQLLIEMDGFEKKEDIIVIGSTNLIKSIDKAILRPGRFDKIINFTLPSKKARKEIFEHYLTKIKFRRKKFNSSVFINRTVGFTPADLKNLVNIAAINAVKRNSEYTTIKDLDNAFDRVLMGIKGKNSNKGFTKEDLKSIAYHEIGHTIISLYNNRFLDVHKVTILPVGGSLGHTALIPKLEDNEITKKSILGSIDIALGGRAAEEIFLGEDNITVGCSNDLNKATQMAYDLILTKGLEKGNFLLQEDKKKLSGKTRLEIDNRVQEILNQRYVVVKNIINDNKKEIEVLVDRLVEKETLHREEIIRFFKRSKQNLFSVKKSKVNRIKERKNLKQNNKNLDKNDNSKNNQKD